MEQPLVSIIMGAYNEEKNISLAIESIMNQTYNNWEFIICNDCSSDGTLKILKEYEEADSRFIVLNNEKNLRLAASLNRCLEISKGKYIARMDADDISKPERIEKQVCFLEKHPEYDVVGTLAEVSNGERIVELRRCKEIPDIDVLLRTTPFVHPSIMMRTEVYMELGGYTISDRTKRGQDWDLWFRFYAAGHKGYNIQEPLIIYHESSEDYKKRNFKSALGFVKTAFAGYKVLGIPKVRYYLALKPLVSYFIPQKIKQRRRNRKSRV